MRTPKQSLQTRLAILKRHFYRFRRLPTYEEMGVLFSISSKATVARILKHFLDAGFIEKDEAGKIVPTSLFFSIPLLGSIKAGYPVTVEVEEFEVIPVNEYVLGRADSTYALKVSGDSMIEAGLQPGDTVVLDGKRPPKKGDIVAAYVDNEWTLKYYMPEGQTVRLVPANSKYEPIIPRNTLEIGGVVVSSFRKYH